MGKVEDAYRGLGRILDADPWNLYALIVKSALLLGDGRHDEALAAAQRATRSHSGSAAAFYAVGRAQTALGDVEAASSAYREVLRINPRASGVQVELARLKLRVGDSSEAVALSEDALKATPGSLAARLILVRGLLAQGQLNQAGVELDKLLKRYPGSAAIHVQNAVLLARRGDLVGAKSALERATTLDPTSVDALRGLIGVDLATKNTIAARNRLKKWIENPAAPSEALLIAATTYAAIGDGQEAERILRRILAKDAAYLPGYAALGRLYVAQHRLDAALREFDTLAARSPRSAVPHTLAGTILEAQGNSTEAQRRYERALEIDSSAAVAANNLAWLYAQRQERLDEALQLAEVAHRALPTTAEVSDTLGFIYLKTNRLPEALSLLAPIAEKEPANPLYQFHLGMTLAKLGRRVEARDALTRALKLKPDLDGADDARMILASLGAMP
jgi:tetratricopeptide (TPR) repeat protein